MKTFDGSRLSDNGKRLTETNPRQSDPQIGEVSELTGLGIIFEGKYRIIGEIGRGCFGIVYRVEEIQTNKTLALKTLLPWAENDEIARKRFEREAKYNDHLKHPCTVQIEYFGTTADNKPYLLMELVQGQVLSKVLKRHERLSISRVTSIARQVVAALAEAHEQGIVHGDLKPEYLFLCPGKTPNEETVKISDFGNAKLVDEESDLASDGRLTMNGSTLGTVHYMSPEQAEGGMARPASDFYSLGVLLFEMVTGRLPYTGSSPVAVIIMHSTAPVPVLPEAIDRTPLGKAITKCMQKNPEDHPASAAEFLEILNETASVAASEEPVIAVPAATTPGGYGLPQFLARNWLTILIVALLILLVASQF